MPLLNEEHVTRRALITGRVQGVWFRGWTCDQAAALGLAGWVRNRRDGRVEALFSGPAAAVDEMLDACRNGPPHAIVEAVEIRPAEPPNNAGFHQQATK